MAAAGAPRVCNLNDFLRVTCFFLLGGLGREVHNWKSHSDFIFWNYLFFWNIMVTCDEKIKVLSSHNVLLWIFLKIWHLIWRYAELNRFLVGLGQIPLNIELKQDDYTVCCSHTVVRADFLIQQLWLICSISSTLTFGKKISSKGFFWLRNNMFLATWKNHKLSYPVLTIFNRPGVAGAVLQTHLLLID